MDKTEIDPWAYITHTDDDRPPGGIYSAYDRETDELVGELSYFFLNEDHTEIQFKDVNIVPAYQRRRVATALLRHLNFCHPDARINPGVRNMAGEGFYEHLLKTEAAKVSTNGILNVPLARQLPPGFRPGDALLRMAGGQ